MLKSFKEAKKSGDKYYRPTGRCKRNHESPYLVTGGCLECARLRVKARQWSKWGHKLTIKDVELVEAHIADMVENNAKEVGLEIISRPDAMAIGRKTFFDGMPCRVRGHVCERYTKNKACMMCWKEDSKTDSYKEDRKRWRDQNNERHRASVEKWKRENRDRGRLSAANRRAAKIMRSSAFDAELMDFCVLEAYQQCEDMAALFGGSWEVDHMVPLQADIASGFHAPWNIQVIPQQMNAAKSNRMIYTEPMEWLADAT